MVTANLKIIIELKTVLEEISNNAELRSLFTTAGTDFSRDRKLSLKKIVGIIINIPKRSLSIEIQEFFNLIKDSSPATKGAFSQQRTKLLPLFFQVWNHWLVNSFYEHYAENVKRWKGFRLLAVDGSTAYLIHKKDVEEYFGTQGNQHSQSPMARVMQVYDVLNDITVMSNMYPIETGEQSIIAKHIESLYADSITLFDRGFPSYELMFMMMKAEAPRHFVIRCKTTFNKEVIAFVKSNKKSQQVEISPTAYAIAGLRKKGYKITSQTTISIRMVKVKLPSGEVEVLLTNLYDESLYSNADLKYLYGLRWGIETSYGMQKNQLQMEQFSGHRVICIQQDFAASVFVANLQSIISKQCDEYLHEINQTRKLNYKVNRNLSIAVVKNNIVTLFLNNNPNEILLQMQNMFQRNIEPIRPNRKYNRTLKVKFRRGKYRTLTNYKRAV